MGWGFPAEAFSWFIIQDVGDVVEHILRDFACVVFGQPPSYSAVCVLDGAFLPRAVRVTEEGLAWQGMVLGELHAIIEGDGFGLEGCKCVGQPFSNGLSVFSIGIVDDKYEARFALDGSDEVVFLLFEVHEVGLPVVIMVSVVDVS